MKIQGFLDHLLKSSSGNGSVLNADFGKGALDPVLAHYDPFLLEG